MTRRILTFGIVGIPLALAILVLWQPKIVKQRVLTWMTTRISASSHYEVAIRGVSGNVLTGFTFSDIRIQTKKDHATLLTAQSFRISVSWTALLLHKTIQLQTVDFRQPTLHLERNASGHLMIPPAFSASPARPANSRTFLPPITLKNLSVEEGQIVWTDHSTSPASPWTLQGLTLKASGNLEQLNINTMQLTIDGGLINGRGHLRFEPRFSGDLILNDTRIPIEKILSHFATIPRPLRLMHSGTWALKASSERISLAMNGQLSDAPMSLRGVWKTDGHYEAHVSWRDAPLYRVWVASSSVKTSLSASLDINGSGWLVNGSGHIATRGISPGIPWTQGDIRWHEGRGIFQIQLGLDDLQGSIQGKVNLPTRTLDAAYEINIPHLNVLADSMPEWLPLTGHAKGSGHVITNAESWTVTGDASAQDVIWQQTTLQKIDATFSLSPRRQTWTVTADHLQFQGKTPQPLDLSSVQFSGNGLSPRWQSRASATFRDGATLNTDGSLAVESAFTQWSWQHLTVVFPVDGQWTAQTPGDLSWSGQRGFAVHHLSLVNGNQSIQMVQGQFNKTSYRLDAAIKHLDPGPWAKLFSPSIVVQGTLDSTLQVEGSKTQSDVSGFIDGEFPTLTVTPIGLALQNVDLEWHGSNQKEEDVHLTAKTKKGDIQMTGHSQWPRLDYSLHANKLMFAPSNVVKATGDAELHLGGTFDSPALTGQIAIHEAMYTTPKKTSKDQKKDQESVSVSSSPVQKVAIWKRGTLDVAIQWPRNVWYKDGLSSIETHGDLRIQKTSSNPDLLLTGLITSIRGSYSYYGRAFNIASGEIQFTGTPELNPQLNIEATYANGPTTVYLDITGTANQPILKMHSNPPLSDQDIVAVIVFGQPLSELRSRTGGSSSNQEMMQAVGGVLGSYVSKGLNQTGIPILNFDVLNIQPADQGGSQLTVGRYLTRKLFISYGQTVQGSAEKSITADYFLTDKWTLQGASDSVEGNYMDFLFRYPLNKHGAAGNNSPLPNSPFRNSLDQPVFQQQFRTPMQ